MASSRVCVGANGYDFDGSDSAALAAPYVSASISDTVVAGKGFKFPFFSMENQFNEIPTAFPCPSTPGSV
jgi:hypothetical protein